MNNILEFIRSHTNLNIYYEEICQICASNNYDLMLRYKIEGDVTNLGFFDPDNKVIGIEEKLSYEDKISCIAHELAHVDLKFTTDLEMNLTSLEEKLNNWLDKIYLDNHLTSQIKNTIHHCLIDKILSEKKLSNHLFHVEIKKVNAEEELTVIHDDFLESDENGYSVEVPIRISSLNNPENIQEQLMPFQTLLTQLIFVEKKLNGYSEDNFSDLDQELFQKFYEFKKNEKSIEQIVDFLYYFLGIKFDNDSAVCN